MGRRSLHQLAALEIELVREAGALTALPLALSASVVPQIFDGELAAAASLIDEVKIATEATGSKLAPLGSLVLAAWRGREADLSQLLDGTVTELSARGEGIGVSCCQWANAVLHNGLGQYETAVTSAQQLLGPPLRLDANINWVAYFAATVPDRGDDFFAHFDERHARLLAWPAAGTDYFHVLVRDSGEALGRVNLTEIADGCAELGFRVAEKATGRGLATAGVRQVCALVSMEYGLVRLRARATDDNRGSRTVLARTGFTETGAILLNGQPGIGYSRSLVNNA